MLTPCEIALLRHQELTGSEVRYFERLWSLRWSTLNPTQRQTVVSQPHGEVAINLGDEIAQTILNRRESASETEPQKQSAPHSKNHGSRRLPPHMGDGTCFVILAFAMLLAGICALALVLVNMR